MAVNSLPQYNFLPRSPLLARLREKMVGGGGGVLKSTIYTPVCFFGLSRKTMDWLGFSSHSNYANVLYSPQLWFRILVFWSDPDADFENLVSGYIFFLKGSDRIQS